MKKNMTKTKKLTAKITGIGEPRDIVRYPRMQFHKYKEKNIELLMERQLAFFWDDMAALAHKGYEQFGKGFVFIKANCCSSQLGWGENLYMKTAVYVTEPTTSKSLCNENLLNDYDPENEFVFVIEFFDGRFEGITQSDGIVHNLALAA